MNKQMKVKASKPRAYRILPIVVGLSLAMGSTLYFVDQDAGSKRVSEQIEQLMSADETALSEPIVSNPFTQLTAPVDMGPPAHERATPVSAPDYQVTSLQSTPHVKTSVTCTELAGIATATLSATSKTAAPAEAKKWWT